MRRWLIVKLGKGHDDSLALHAQSQTEHHSDGRQNRNTSHQIIGYEICMMTESPRPTGEWLPWARCNLRRNPFGELTPQERAEVAVVDVEAIARRVERTGKAVQLIGDCGRGKTTRMLALARRLPGASYVYLPEDGPCPPIAEGSPLLIDEAQRLPRAAWRRVFATGLPLVLATHRNMKRLLRRFGYAVHTEWIGEGNTPELICRLLNRRMEAARLRPGPIPVISMDDADRLFKNFGSDIRGIENYLYERVQIQVVHHGEMRFVD